MEPKLEIVNRINNPTQSSMRLQRDEEKNERPTLHNRGLGKSEGHFKDVCKARWRLVGVTQSWEGGLGWAQQRGIRHITLSGRACRCQTDIMINEIVMIVMAVMVTMRRRWSSPSSSFSYLPSRT